MAAKEPKDKETALPEGQAEKPKKKSRAKRLVIIIVLLLMILCGVGMGAYWWLYLREPGGGQATSEPQEVAEPVAQEKQQEPAQGAQANLNSARIERQSDLPRSGGLVLPLPPVTVNLADPNGRRYLKLGMEVEVNGDVANELKAQNARIRDSIIMLLAGKTYGEIASPDGKVLLKAEIAARLNQILGAQRVIRVYLTDFVVQ